MADVTLAAPIPLATDSEVESPARRLRQRVERRFQGREGLRAAHGGPPGRHSIELQACQGPEQAPEPWPADDGVGRQPGEPPPEVELDLAHGVRKWIRTSCPGPAPNVSAALPPLIAIATFP